MEEQEEKAKTFRISMLYLPLLRLIHTHKIGIYTAK